MGKQKLHSNEEGKVRIEPKGQKSLFAETISKTRF